MKNRNVVELPTEGSAALQPNDNTEKQKTDKRYLKRAEKIVRKLDNALSELNNVAIDLEGFYEQTEFNSADIAEKDSDRIDEMREVLSGTIAHIYHLTNRMSRKYVGKPIDGLGKKRKSLKV